MEMITVEEYETLKLLLDKLRRSCALVDQKINEAHSGSASYNYDDLSYLCLDDLVDKYEWFSFFDSCYPHYESTAHNVFKRYVFDNNALEAELQRLSEGRDKRISEVKERRLAQEKAEYERLKKQFESNS